MSVLLEKRPKGRETGRGEFSADFGFTRSVLTEDSAKSFVEKHPSATPKANTGDLVLEGYANTWVEDRDFEVILKDAFDGSLDAYLKKNPVMLWQHDHDKPIGQIAEAYTDDTGLYVRAFVRKPEAGEDGWRISAYNDLKAGIVRTMSIGGWFTREVVENLIAVTKVELFEISTVSVPSNPDSIFEAATKSIFGMPMKPTASKTASLAAQLLGIEPISDPGLVRLDENGKRARYLRLSADIAEEGRALPEYGAWATLAAEMGEAKAAASLDAGVVLKLAKNAESIAAAVYGKSPGAAEKGAFSTVYEGYELMDTLWDGMWALRQALYEVLDTDGDGLPNTDVSPADIVLTVNEFRDWLVALMATGEDALAGMVSDLKVLGGLMGAKEAVAV